MTEAPLAVGLVQMDGREVRASLNVERGRRVLDVREFARFAGVMMPGKNGLTLPVEHLDALSDLLAEAIARAKAAGWITEDGKS